MVPEFFSPEIPTTDIKRKQKVKCFIPDGREDLVERYC